MYYLGKSEENMDLSHIYLAVHILNSVHPFDDGTKLKIPSEIKPPFKDLLK